MTISTERQDFAQAVIAGLSEQRKSLPCRYFYDARGSELFEAITELPEYYPTRTELRLLQAQAPEIAARAPRGAVLVEFGSGSSRKTEVLLAAMTGLAAYVPIDVSGDALDEAATRLAQRFRGLRVLPVTGDFSAPLALPHDLAEAPRVGFFPGSTIGNFAPDAARELLAGLREQLAGGSLIIGVDLRKALSVLLPAYNDAAGTTADFNLNLLVRINRELSGSFDLRGFRHEAIWNEADSRIEMHLVSRKAQEASAAGHAFHFAEGERIHTENSCKYDLSAFARLAGQAGWRVARVWTDPDGWFSLQELEAA
jgi:dimethylhistidine N-methyltransferase